MKSLALNKPSKDQREKLILMGVVDFYLNSGKPVGSNSLKEHGFKNLSSATIRNYFAKLEADGYLTQQHSSGGRIPTHLAYRAYVKNYLKSPLIEDKISKFLKSELSKETRELASYLQHAAETISEASSCAVFLSAPRFDQDFVLDVKLMGIDNSRLLCILITDFGLVQTELLYANKKLSSFTLKRLENFFRWKLTQIDQPKLSKEEEALATKLYGEVMLRHLVGHAHFNTEDIYKTGFSKLLGYSDFNDATALAGGLGLFENKEVLNALLRECQESGELKCWIGGELQACSAIAIPYRINQTIVGSIAILGPNRIPYRKLFGILKAGAEIMTHSLTKSMYKFKITFKQPDNRLIDRQTEHLLLENKHE